MAKEGIIPAEAGQENVPESSFEKYANAAFFVAESYKKNTGDIEKRLSWLDEYYN